MRSKLAYRAMLGGAVFVLGATAAIVGTTIASADYAEPSGRVDQFTEATTDWPRNADGLTYGSGLDSKAPADMPDLVMAYATNGKVGYVKRAELEQAAPRNPQEALANQAKLAGVDRRIAVYEVDGKTRIGVFVISHSDGKAGMPMPHGVR